MGRVPGDLSVLMEGLCNQFRDEKPLSGLSVALLTALDEQRNVDQESQFEHAKLLVKYGGVRNLVLFGMNGEGDQVTDDHVRAVIESASKIQSEYPHVGVITSMFCQTREQILARARVLAEFDNVSYDMIAPPLLEGTEAEAFPILCKDVHDITKRPFLVYRTGQSPATKDVDMELLLNIRGQVGESEFAGVKNTSGGLDLLTQYARQARANGSSLAFQYLQGDDRLTGQAVEVLIALEKEGLYPYKPGNLSGSSNVLPLAQMTHIMYGALFEASKRPPTDQFGSRYLSLAKEIQEYITNEALQVLGNGQGFEGIECGREESKIWKAMGGLYVPGMKRHCINPKIVQVDDEQAHLLQRHTEGIANKRDYFLRTYDSIRKDEAIHNLTVQGRA